MAIFLSLDKRQYNSEGLVSLRRGDDWKVNGYVQEIYARYNSPLDLTGCAATGFWPAASGGVMAEPFVITDAKGGAFEMDVPASDTPNIALEEATTIYATVQHPDKGLITIETSLPVIQIEDRNFTNG